MSWTGSFARAVASAFYWWGVGWLIYMVTGGDRMALGQEHSVWQDYSPVSLVVIGAVVLNAVLTRFDRGRR